MRNLKIAAAVLVGAAFLGGCTQSNIVTPEGQAPAAPIMETRSDIEIDWSQVQQVLRDEFIDPYGEYADYVLEIEVSADPDTGDVTILLPVTGEPTQDIAIAYGEDVLKACGDELATQDFSYAPSEEEGTYYGGYFDSHSVTVQMFPYMSQDDESTYLINDTLEAGEQRALQAQTE